MFYYKIPWFYQDFKSENLFLKSAPSSRCENTEPVTRDHVKSSQMRNGTLCNHKGYSFISEQVLYFCLRKPNSSMFFKMY